jgi:cytochrome c oxidase assembly factor CtaG
MLNLIEVMMNVGFVSMWTFVSVVMIALGIVQISLVLFQIWNKRRSGKE